MRTSGENGDSAAPQLQLQISDNGRGLSPPMRSGVGFLSMRERAKELGGTWAIALGDGGGTHVIVRIPLPQELR